MTDYSYLKTPTGKTIQDFQIPAWVMEKDEELLDLIMRSESMKDSERQYWFNLLEVMNEEQIERLRDILKRERQKLAEIDAKYGVKREDPVEAAKRAEEQAAKRASQQEAIRKREEEHRQQADNQAEDILSELDELN